MHPDRRLAGQIGNRPGALENSVEALRREVDLRQRDLEQALLGKVHARQAHVRAVTSSLPSVWWSLACSGLAHLGRMGSPRPASPSGRLERTPLMYADRALAPSLIGRQAPLRACDERLRLARGGARQVVLIAGEAGIGKTRLLREFLGRVRATEGIEIVEGCCYEGGSAVPYGPFIDALRGLVRERGTSALVQAAGLWTGELARLLPELASPAPASPAMGDPEA